MPIVNNARPDTSLFLEDAVQIYTGKITSWPNGEKIIVVLLPRDSPVTRAFILDHLQMSPYQFFESVNISINIRKNNSILNVRTEYDMIKQITKTPGSIGFTSEYMYYNHNSDVKRIKIK